MLTDNSRTRINLGAGERPLSGWTNQDLYPGEAIDLVFDLDQDWPIADNSVDEYHCSHTLEHLKDIIHFFREVQRTLKPMGTISIQVPHGFTTAAMADPTHIRPIFPETFASFTYDRQENKSWNPQHDPSRFPYQFIITSIELVAAKWVRHLPLWKRWAPWASNKILSVFDEIRIDMQHLPPENYSLFK